MDKTLEQIRSYAEQGGGRIICHRAEYDPRFFVFRAEKASGGGAPCGFQKSEQLCRGGQSTAS